MGFLSGFLNDTNQRIDSARKEERDRQDTIDANERAVLSHLTTSEDPNIAGRAISALAEMGAGGVRPKGGYLNRLVTGGQASMHPVVEQALNTIFHSPSSIDVESGRATPAGGGAPPTGAPAGAAGGVSPVGPTPGGRGGTPQGGGPSGAPPPVVARTPAPGSAAQPSQAATEPGGGPQAGTVTFAPGGPPPVVAPGMAGVSFAGAAPQGAGAGGAAPAGAPPPQVAAAPAAPQGAGAGAAAAGGPPQVQAGGGAQLPVAGTPQGPNYFAQTHRTPEQQRAATLRTENSFIQPTLEAKVNASLAVWRQTHQGASADDEQQAKDLIVYKETGTLPKFSPVAGSTTVEQAIEAYGDRPLDPLTENSPMLSTLAPGSFINTQRAGQMMRFNPVTPNAQIVAQNRAPTLTSLAATEAGVVPGTAPTPAQSTAALAILARRQVALQQSGAKFREDATLDERKRTWKPITFLVKDADGTGHPVSGVINGIGDQAVAGPDGQPMKDANGNVVAPPEGSQPAPYGSAAALPNKIGESAMQTLGGLKTLQTVNEKLLALIHDAHMEGSNNPITPKALNELYSHGISTADLDTEIPFDTVNQLLGYSEATGLRNALAGGRTNIKLQDILSAHLAGPGQTFQAAYERLKGLNDTIIPAARDGIISAQGTKLGPGGAGGTGSAGAGGSGAATGAPADFPVTFQGHVYHFDTAAKADVFKRDNHIGGS